MEFIGRNRDLSSPAVLEAAYQSQGAMRNRNAELIQLSRKVGARL